MIKYVPEGDKFKASQLWGEGRHQLSILKNAMSFRGLQQDQKQGRFSNGTIIKCLSCFDQDVITIYVPSPPAGGEPQRRRRVDIKYYPAIEVYDAAHWDAKYMGVVICKGNGFDPPYEFLPKDSLPRDYATEPLGRLPKERKWGRPSPERTFEDIVPKGVTDVYVASEEQPAPTFWAPGAFLRFIVRSERLWSFMSGIWCWKYCAEAEAEYYYSRTEALNINEVLSFVLPEDTYLGKWDKFYFEGHLRAASGRPTITVLPNGTTKPNIINIESLGRFVTGTGTNNFKKPIGATYAQGVIQDAIKYVIDGYVMGIPFGHYERDDVNVNFGTIYDAAIVEAETISLGFDPEALTFPEFSTGEHERFDFLHGAYPDVYAYPFIGIYDYTYHDRRRNIWYADGSVMDCDDHNAVAYSLRTYTKSVKFYTSITDLSKCMNIPYHSAEGCPEQKETVIIDTSTEGPLCVVVDGVIFELFPETEPEVAPRLQECSVRYFRVGDRSIGLFRLAKNYYYPSDYFYVYADVIHKEGENPVGNSVFVTMVKDYEEDTDSSVYTIPGVTDLEGKPLYGKEGVRLIKETVTTHEIQKPETPGLWEKEFK